MANPLLAFIDERLGSDFLPLIRQKIVGIAQDFWKDGADNPLVIKFPKSKKVAKIEKEIQDESFSESEEHNTKSYGHARKKKIWHAMPAEISERMWGDGLVTPGGDYIADMMIKPIGLTQEMSVLDLSAGLGGRTRKIAAEYGSYITGLEPDPGVARRGMELSLRAGKVKHAPVEHYDPESLSLRRMYDCVLARETVYRVKDKDRLFKTISAGMKLRAHLTFTDYIVNPEDRDKPAIVAWRGFETPASPLGLLEMFESWKKYGVELRISEDLTAYYKKEVLKGLQRLAIFLGSDITPDSETKTSLRKRLSLWTHRLAAMEEGMKFYRFYGTKL